MTLFRDRVFIDIINEEEVTLEQDRPKFNIGVPIRREDTQRHTGEAGHATTEAETRVRQP